MLKEWQFNVLFFVGVGGAILLLLGPEVGMDIGQNPLSASGVGTILAYVLTQKKALVKSEDQNDNSPNKREGDNNESR